MKQNVQLEMLLLVDGVIFLREDEGRQLARLHLILRDQHFHGVSEKLSGPYVRVRPSIHSDETNGPERKGPRERARSDF